MCLTPLVGGCINGLVVLDWDYWWDGEGGGAMAVTREMFRYSASESAMDGGCISIQICLSLAKSDLGGTLWQ